MKPRRSLLFAPASDLRKAEKALSLDADGVILDLEDAVALAEKIKARSLALDVLGRAGGKAVYVRVNGVASPFLVGDLMAVMGGRPAGIVLPKAESAEEVKRVDWLMGQLEKEYEIPDQIELIPLIETARGVINAYEIAAAGARVKCLAFGAVDYTLDIGTSLSAEGDEIFYARAHLVVASRAAGREAPIDTVYPDLKNPEGLARECRLARRLGYQGKLVIHPAQIGPVNEIFSPTEKEIAYARRVVEAFREAESRGVAAVQLEGKFIDYPVAVWAERILAIAGCLGLPSALEEKTENPGGSVFGTTAGESC